MCATGKWVRDQARRLDAVLRDRSILSQFHLPPPKEPAEERGDTATFQASNRSAKTLVPGLELLAEGALKTVVERVLPWQEVA